MSCSAQAERRVLICDEQESIRLDAQAPPAHPHDEVEQSSRVSAGEEDREPSEYHGEECDDRQQRQHNVVRDRQEPLDQRQPPIQVAFHVRVVDLQVYGLLLDGRRILIRQQQEVGADPR